MLNTIDDRLQIQDKGDVVVVTGPIGCPEGQLVDIHVKVDQAEGRSGTGRFSASCTGEQDEWMAFVDAWGPAFEAGEARARAWATTWKDSEIVRSWSWSKEVTLAGRQ